MRLNLSRTEQNLIGPYTTDLLANATKNVNNDLEDKAGKDVSKKFKANLEKAGEQAGQQIVNHISGQLKQVANDFIQVMGKLDIVGSISTGLNLSKQFREQYGRYAIGASSLKDLSQTVYSTYENLTYSGVYINPTKIYEALDSVKQIVSLSGTSVNKLTEISATASKIQTTGININISNKASNYLRQQFGIGALSDINARMNLVSKQFTNFTEDLAERLYDNTIFLNMEASLRKSSEYRNATTQFQQHQLYRWYENLLQVTGTIAGMFNKDTAKELVDFYTSIMNGSMGFTTIYGSVLGQYIANNMSGEVFTQSGKDYYQEHPEELMLSIVRGVRQMSNEGLLAGTFLNNYSGAKGNIPLSNEALYAIANSSLTDADFVKQLLESDTVDFLQADDEEIYQIVSDTVNTNIDKMNMDAIYTGFKMGTVTYEDSTVQYISMIAQLLNNNAGTLGSILKKFAGDNSVVQSITEGLGETLENAGLTIAGNLLSSGSWFTVAAIVIFAIIGVIKNYKKYIEEQHLRSIKYSDMMKRSRNSIVGDFSLLSLIKKDTGIIEAIKNNKPIPTDSLENAVKTFESSANAQSIQESYVPEFNISNQSSFGGTSHSIKSKQDVTAYLDELTKSISGGFATAHENPLAGTPGWYALTSREFISNDVYNLLVSSGAFDNGYIPTELPYVDIIYGEIDENGNKVIYGDNKWSNRVYFSREITNADLALDDNSLAQLILGYRYSENTVPSITAIRYSLLDQLNQYAAVSSDYQDLIDSLKLQTYLQIPIFKTLADTYTEATLLDHLLDADSYTPNSPYANFVDNFPEILRQFWENKNIYYYNYLQDNYGTPWVSIEYLADIWRVTEGKQQISEYLAYLNNVIDTVAPTLDLDTAIKMYNQIRSGDTEFSVDGAPSLALLYNTIKLMMISVDDWASLTPQYASGIDIVGNIANNVYNSINGNNISDDYLPTSLMSQGIITWAEYTNGLLNYIQMYNAVNTLDALVGYSLLQSAIYDTIIGSAINDLSNLQALAIPLSQLFASYSKSGTVDKLSQNEDYFGVYEATEDLVIVLAEFNTRVMRRLDGILSNRVKAYKQKLNGLNSGNTKFSKCII